MGIPTELGEVYEDALSEIGSSAVTESRKVIEEVVDLPLTERDWAIATALNEYYGGITNKALDKANDI